MKVVINDKYRNCKELVAFLENLDSIFDSNGTPLHIARNAVKSFHIDELGREVVVKRYKVPMLIQRVIYSYFRKSKAERAYMNAVKLTEFGFETPYPIAYVEQKSFGLMGYSYFVSEKTEYESIQPTMLLERPLEPSLAESLTKFFVDLHTKGILHNDLNAGNILFYRDVEANYHFQLIDNNRMDFLKDEIPFDKRMENICKFSNEEIYQQVVACYADKIGMPSQLAIEKAMEARRKWADGRNRRKAFLAKFRNRK